MTVTKESSTSTITFRSFLINVFKYEYDYSSLRHSLTHTSLAHYKMPYSDKKNVTVSIIIITHASTLC